VNDVKSVSQPDTLPLFANSYGFQTFQQIFIRFEVNKKGFIPLFRIEANQQIHAKQIKTGASISF
jgi:hypothetical protein